MWSTVFAAAEAPIEPGPPTAVPSTAQPGDTPAPQGGSNPFLGGPWVIMIGMIAIFYFLLIRPNQKRERERRDMLSALAKGDRVVTSGGIVGAIVGLTEKMVVLRVSDDPPVKMELLRGAISRVINREDQKGTDE